MTPTFKAKDAPTPRLEPLSESPPPVPEPPLPPLLPLPTFVVTFEEAETLLAVVLTAVSVTSPPVRVMVALSPITALFPVVTTLTDNEPATPILSEPAPDTDLAPNSLLPSAPPTPAVPSSVIRASMTILCAATVSVPLPSPSNASDTESATLIATATPTPKVAVASPAPVALPSATADASVSLLARKVNVPPASTAPTLSEMNARALEAAMFTATAPATLMLRLDVFASAFMSPVEPLPARDSPSPRLSLILLVTLSSPSGSVVVPSSSSPPPAALAFACAELSEAESATNITEPPAVIARAVVASAVSLTTFTAIDSPIPAFAPTASPLVSVVVVPRCVAVALNAPPSTNALGSFPMNASVVLFATLTPTAPPTATPPVDVAPVCASVSITCVPVALNVTSFRLPASTTPLPSKAPMAARVSLSATFTATDAPTPRLPPFAPPSFGSAFAVLALVFAASNDTSPVPPATN